MVIWQGFVEGKQRYKCRICKFQSIRSEIPDPIPRQKKLLRALCLFLSGLSKNMVAKHMGVSCQSVCNWIREMGDYEKLMPKPKGNLVTIEMDEMWHFLQSKKQKLWIGKAYCRETGELVAFSFGKRYFDMKCEASLMHEAFCREDAKAMQTGKEVRSIGIALYAGGHSVMLGSKVPRKDASGQISGSISHYQDVTNLKLINLNSLLSSANCDDLKRNGQISLELSLYGHDEFSLSKRESEVLFYALRGGTASTIGARLFVSKRTIERHFENIKTKMQCQSKSEIIEKAIDLGFMSQLPPGLV